MGTSSILAKNLILPLHSALDRIHPRSNTHRAVIPRPMLSARQFGPIPGFPVGSVFPDRKTLTDSGIHRPPMAGIWGGKAGAESIVISGGYEDDIDEWDVVIYTGHGGNDTRTKKQIAHQQLIQGNLGLVANLNSGAPVRVIRGARSHTEFSPRFGYRYDGLYRVERYWPEEGKSGFRIYRFEVVSVVE